MVKSFEIVNVDLRPDIFNLPLIDQLDLLLFVLTSKSREDVLREVMLFDENDTYAPNEQILHALNKASADGKLHDLWNLTMKYFPKMQDMQNPFLLSEVKYN